MKEEDVNDIFKDFEFKVEPKKESKEHPKTEHHKTHEKEHPHKESSQHTGLSEEELLKRKYEQGRKVLEEKYGKEKKALESERVKEMVREGRMPKRGLPFVERSAFIAVIVILVLFIGIDLSFYHGDDVDTETVIAAAVTKEENLEEPEEIEITEEEVPVKTEEPIIKLSGKVSFDITKINMAVSDSNDDLGYINSVIFTIDNGLEESVTPLVHVFVFDSELHDSWETRSRGIYTGPVIESGDKRTGTVSLSPRSFSNLDIEKNLRLILNDTKQGFLGAVNDKIVIS